MPAFHVRIHRHECPSDRVRSIVGNPAALFPFHVTGERHTFSGATEFPHTRKGICDDHLCDGALVSLPILSFSRSTYNLFRRSSSTPQGSKRSQQKLPAHLPVRVAAVKTCGSKTYMNMLRAPAARSRARVRLPSRTIGRPPTESAGWTRFSLLRLLDRRRFRLHRRRALRLVALMPTLRCPPRQPLVLRLTVWVLKKIRSVNRQRIRPRLRLRTVDCLVGTVVMTGACFQMGQVEWGTRRRVGGSKGASLCGRKWRGTLEGQWVAGGEH